MSCQSQLLKPKLKVEESLTPVFLSVSRETDELDSEVISICKEVSKRFFKGKTKPGKEDILNGYKDLIGDVVFNSIGSVTARKIAQKEF